MTPEQVLESETVPVRLLHSQWTPRKAWTVAERHRLADLIKADAGRIAGLKVLIPVTAAIYRSVKKIKSKAVKYWRSNTIEFPVPKVRLLWKDQVEEFNTQLGEYREQFVDAVGEFAAAFDTLHTADTGLGTFYSKNDYPEDVASQFDLAWDYPTFRPSVQIKSRNPKLYSLEFDRYEHQYRSAVIAANLELAAELETLVRKLAAVLADQEVAFKDKSIRNVVTFCERWERLKFLDQVDLSAKVKTVHTMLRNVDPAEVRAKVDARTRLADKLAALQ